MANCDSSYYFERKGIYKDLYRTINEGKKPAISRSKKGIYRHLYRQLEEDKKPAKQKNIWHTYPLKAMVYSNDFGEAAKPLIGAFLAKLSWVPTIIYAFFALLGKYLQTQKNKNSKESFLKEVLFQLLASFLLPFLLIKSSHKLAQNFIDNRISVKTKQKIKDIMKSSNFLETIVGKFRRNNSSGYRNLGLSAVGVATIAIGAKPIDIGVEYFLNRIYKDNN